MQRWNRYEEAMSAFKQTPKKIVRSEIYNYNSEKEIGLAGAVESGGGLGVIGANAYLYGEMIASAQLEKPLRNRYEAELYQHSNAARYYVDAGLKTKEEMNEWLKEGYWFKYIKGRFPTPEDKEGVDIEKYLIHFVGEPPQGIILKNI